VEPVFEEKAAAVGAVSPTTAAFLTEETDVGEGLRGVGSRLRLDESKRGFRTLAVVSSIQGEGKTSVALGLAAALARAGRRPLLVDADLRRRDATALLQLEPERGLAEWLEKGLSTLTVRRISPLGFHLLSAGVGPCRPEMLGSPRMVALLGAAERAFDLVILDCAPLLPVADTLAMRETVGAFVLVARTRYTRRAALVRAASLLEPERLVGVVLNGERPRFAKYRGYAYGYGYKYGADRRAAARR
jgi:Mrp family chromosome partitioning ATPase